VKNLSFPFFPLKHLNKKKGNENKTHTPPLPFLVVGVLEQSNSTAAHLRFSSTARQ
jgi:hypothetical protein